MEKIQMDKKNQNLKTYVPFGFNMKLNHLALK